ncbi:putative sulfate exporter family transporter [Desulfallas sp. Bu1-1]|uniref:YeiH family protein n=1 Tax=Desulfallas sp. Bu1-1 TaxID=2787620 RepID=UPI00189F5B18|nr:putative sulfate exporter family transporter [Desulfallas sp. Bu1-1]MBF7084287.1 putative sulfate exporter family transporter [Desulfallas sp. Bu1-1]
MSNKPATASGGWSDLYKKEDWWAVWLGIGLVLAAILFWFSGSSIKLIAFDIPGWTEFGAVTAYLGSNLESLILMFIVFTVLFSIAVKILGHKLSEFIPGFLIIFVMAVMVSIFGSWEWAKKYNLEAPLVALGLGLIISNVLPVPKWFEAALRTEFYVKVGIVLLGATLPFTLIIQAGPVAFTQATVIAVSTFLSIYWAATKLFGLDRRFAATLGAGGSICGVSASIAIGGAVKAEKQHVSVAITLVVVWAIIMIYALPVFITASGIPAGPAGAWIGTSEFADAAGMAAAAAIGDKAITTFTLMKVVGRDMFVGIWAFLLALISITRWEKREDGTKADAGEIWRRFPKFVLGFFVASALVTLIIAGADAATSQAITSDIIKPLKTLRTWAFIFCFLAIGLTTRFRELTSVGWKPFAAFTTGVLINVPLGYIFSVLILGSYWVAVAAK